MPICIIVNFIPCAKIICCAAVQFSAPSPHFISCSFITFGELAQFICTIGGNLCNKVWLDQTDYIHNCSSMESLGFGCMLTIMQDYINISKKYKSRVISLATFISMKDLIQKLRTTLLFWLAALGLWLYF